MASWDTRQGSSGRVLDFAARERRAKKALEVLEKDNFQEDPFADSECIGRKVPALECAEENSRGLTKRKKKTPDYYKNKYVKSFQYLMEEEEILNPGGPNYASAEAPSSKLPKRHFCSVCGFFASYTCVQCGAKYCHPKCLTTHVETRCLKWTV